MVRCFHLKWCTRIVNHLNDTKRLFILAMDAKKIIDLHYAENDLNLTILAEHVSVSTAHLSRALPEIAVARVSLTFIECSSYLPV